MWWSQVRYVPGHVKAKTKSTLQWLKNVRMFAYFLFFWRNQTRVLLYLQLFVLVVSEKCCFFSSHAYLRTDVNCTSDGGPFCFLDKWPLTISGVPASWKNRTTGVLLWGQTQIASAYQVGERTSQEFVLLWGGCFTTLSGCCCPFPSYPASPIPLSFPEFEALSVKSALLFWASARRPRHTNHSEEVRDFLAQRNSPGEDLTTGPSRAKQFTLVLVQTLCFGRLKQCIAECQVA